MKIKTIISAFVVAVFVFASLCVTVCAVSVDGVLSEKQWQSADTQVLISSADSSNCKVSYGFVSIFVEKSKNKIYLGFRSMLSEPINDSTAFGVAVSVNSGDFVYIDADGVSDYNVEEFSLESAVSAYSSAAYSAEVELGVKRGVDSIDTIAVRFIDADGSPSNIYAVDLYDGTLYEEDVSAYSTHTSYTNSVKPDNKVSTTVKRVKNTKKPTEKVNDQSEYVNVDSTSEYFEYNTANTNLSVNDTGEETTVLTQKQLNLQKAFSYAAVSALILLSLGICVAVNVAHDKRESERKSKK